MPDWMPQLDMLWGTFRYQNYVQVQHIFKVSARDIRGFSFGSILATDFQITDASYIRLMHLFGYTEEMGADGSVPKFGPSPPRTSQMRGQYRNVPKKFMVDWRR